MPPRSSQKGKGVKFEDPSAAEVGVEDYDPDQDPETKRALRAKLRAQDYRVSEWAKDPNAVDIEQMSRELENQNLTFRDVRAPQEAALDSGFLTQLSGIATARARNLKHDAAGFDVDDFILKLTTFLGGNAVEANAGDDDDDEDELDDEIKDLDWEKMGWRALGYSRRVVGMEFMLGPLDLEQKKRAVVKRGKQDKNTDAEVRPKELRAEDIVKEDNETTNNVESLYHLLEESGTVNVFELICNPKSFGQTVENLFYLSFLVKDGKIAIELNEETDELTTYAVADYSPEERADEGLGDASRIQAVLQLDEETWRLAIETYGIRESLFPHRAVPADATYKFYGR